MSREHAIYKQGPLHSTPLTNCTVPGSWDEAQLAGARGGVVFEATIISRKRVNLADGSGKKWRYAVLTVDVKRGFKRQYEADGTEIEYATGATKKVSTGYLQSSWKDEQKEKSGEISVTEMRTLWGRTFADLTKFSAADGLVEIWGDEQTVQQMDFENGEMVRVKTRGSSPLLDYIVRMDASNTTLKNFAGDQPGDSWTNKIFSQGKQADIKPLPQDKLQGAADDEWN